MNMRDIRLMQQVPLEVSAREGFMSKHEELFPYRNNQVVNLPLCEDMRITALSESGVN